MLLVKNGSEAEYTNNDVNVVMLVKSSSLLMFL